MADLAERAEQLQEWIDRLASGDELARDELLAHACERLRHLSRKMLRDFAGVARWEQTDDILQNTLLRLWTSLRQVTPRSVSEFSGLAALQIRRELIDLARHYYGPEGMGAHHATHPDAASSTELPQTGPECSDTTYEASRLAIWTEFHERVGALPEEERQVFDLVWYQGLTQSKAAGFLGVSEPTLKRRWWSARRRLHEALRGQLPGE
jgi:RNA polymerase sigma-70 factor (ECF subfamily)